MAIDKLINSTQGDSIIAALNAISSKVGSPYNLENKLNPVYINYDSTHAATPETVANSGITSTDVAQIETNKNNILYNTENGVANIMPVQRSLTKSDSGLNYTIVGDKYILSGSRTIAASYYLVSDNIVLPPPNTDYTIYIDHQNNTTTTQLQIVARDGNTWVDIPGGTTTGLSTINTGNYERFMLRLLPNVTVGSVVNDTVRIMIIPKSLGVTSYQPYALSNTTITPALVECVDNGAKNKVKIDISSGTYASIVTTVSNGVITLSSGTASASPTILTFSEITLPAGNYVLSGCAAGGSDTTYRLDIRSSGTTICGVYGNDFVEFTLSAQTTITVNIRLQGGYSIPGSGLVFKPMVCEKSLYDVSSTHQLYALPNTTLTSGLNSYIENGVRNFAKYNHNMPSWSGVTINVSDDAISVSGTSSSAYTGFICTGLNLLVKEPLVVKVIGTYSGFSIIAQITDTSGTRLYWDLLLDRTLPSGYTIEGVYMQRQSATSSVVSGNFNVLITPKAIYDLGVKDYEPYALSNAELTAQSQKVISTSGNTSKLRLTLDTTVMSNANRGSLLLSIPFQTSSYDNALLLIAIGNDSFLGVQRLDNSNNSMVTSWTLSENNTILDITLRAQPWSAPVAFPMAQVVPPITYSWES